MTAMFMDCSKLTYLDLSNFDTSNVTQITDSSGNGIFRGCSALKDLNIDGWNTAKVENMRNTFYGCSNLTSLDVSNWDTSNVTNMQDMFNGGIFPLKG